MPRRSKGSSPGNRGRKGERGSGSSSSSSRSPGSARRREENGAGSRAPRIALRSGSKKWITCIRHGQSQAQTAIRGERRTSRYLDAPVTGKGLQQAKNLSDRVEKPELVVVSTLTRALQTACLVFKKFKDLKIIATPIVCELGKIPENTPRSIEELKKDYNLQMLPGFDRIDFSNVSAEMKMIGESRSRSSEQACLQFCNWLEKRPERVITLVGHSTFIRKFTGNVRRVENCAPIETVIDTRGVKLMKFEEQGGGKKPKSPSSSASSSCSASKSPVDTRIANKRPSNSGDLSSTRDSCPA
eukprot:jgi/Bigna1/87027/estExt_fgenesh1_pg.C_160058